MQDGISSTAIFWYISLEADAVNDRAWSIKREAWLRKANRSACSFVSSISSLWADKSSLKVSSWPSISELYIDWSSADCSDSCLSLPICFSINRRSSRFCIWGYKLLLSLSMEYIILRELARTKSCSGPFSETPSTDWINYSISWGLGFRSSLYALTLH